MASHHRGSELNEAPTLPREEVMALPQHLHQPAGFPPVTDKQLSQQRMTPNVQTTTLYYKLNIEFILL